ncbi:hypothetical protein EZV62_015458 [Acer yangbiense]|uniref:DUF4283 domain-containing protein n=1 Tax=Acer yangbiense TaxID=1000413 RepID=A0A5C7HLH6_9ROSI|nr:hypothetical protein EZV62_015458 [Acer yangbiense]
MGEEVENQGEETCVVDGEDMAAAARRGKREQVKSFTVDQIKNLGKVKLAGEIAKLCEMLSILDVDGPIRQVSGELRREGLKDVDRCLVGKVLTGKRVNRETFKRVIEQLWSQIRSVEIEAIGDNIFMFIFPSLEVQSMIWSRGPWHFDHNLIVLEKPKEQIGTVVEIPADSRECMGRFIRVKVRINISKPLMRCVRLNMDDSEEIITAILLYEKLPEFCHACGIISHGLRDCLDDNARTKALEGATTKYSSWLRVASLEQAKNRASRKEIKGPENTPSSSNQENQSRKSSETGKSSKNNSNDQEGSLRCYDHRCAHVIAHSKCCAPRTRKRVTGVAHKMFLLYAQSAFVSSKHAFVQQGMHQGKLACTDFATQRFRPKLAHR